VDLFTLLVIIAFVWLVFGAPATMSQQTKWVIILVLLVIFFSDGYYGYGPHLFGRACR
jgi:hypothetical protein